MKHHLGVLALLALAVTSAGEVRGEDRGDRARFRILVPEDAFVFVARQRTKATGAVRLLESPPLQKGRRYTYEISVIHEGQEVVRTVAFEAGWTVVVDFRKEIEQLRRPAEPASRPYRPLRPVWLPGRAWRA